MSYMCVVAVEMADFFDRVSTKKHITATFSLENLGKRLSSDLCGSPGSEHWKSMAKRTHLCVRGSLSPHTSTLARLRRLPFGTGERAYTKNFTRVKQPVWF